VKLLNFIIEEENKTLSDRRDRTDGGYGERDGRRGGRGKREGGRKGEREGGREGGVEMNGET